MSNIICGPIVRHTNRDVINIWFVSNNSTDDYKIEVYDYHHPGKQVSKKSSSKKIAVSDGCVIYMFTNTLDQKLILHCEHVAYDILINGKGIAENGLQSIVCYKNETLPSIPIPVKHTSFLQASCRKPHSEGPRDQLVSASSLIEKNLQSPDRPSQLFFTGDQIYADDVSPVLLDYLQQMKSSLNLPDEFILLDNGKRILPDNKKLDGRTLFATEKKGFTSDNADSQLATLADFLCMYIFAFSGKSAMNNTAFQTYANLKKRLKLAHKNKGPRSTIKHYNFTSREYKKQLTALDKFASIAGNQVRKLLANITSYMIFDDHEVTDDWNLSRKNSELLKTSDVGKHIQVNALVTYYIFQHWGNQPGSAKKDLDSLQRLMQFPNSDTRKDLECLWNRDWGYVLNQQPPIAVLDTRTGRIFHGHRDNNLALMSPERLRSLGTQLSKLPASCSLILVSPTPMFGFSDIESKQLGLSKFKETLDREPWIADEFALQSLQLEIASLPGVKDVLVLSGDVHYAFARRQAAKINNATIIFWQLCSSASCNTPVGGKPGLSFVNFIGKFSKKRTNYLKPERSKEFLTSDKNIGTLILDQELQPSSASLICINAKSNRIYNKKYNLVDYKEITDNKP